MYCFHKIERYGIDNLVSSPILHCSLKAKILKITVSSLKKIFSIFRTITIEIYNYSNKNGSCDGSETIKIDKYDFYSWNTKGNLLSQLNRFPEALECYDEAIKLNSSFDHAYYNLASQNSLLNFVNLDSADKPIF